MKTSIFAVILLLAITGILSFHTIEKRLSSKRIFHPEPTGSVYIIIDKSDYELQVYDEEGWYASYPVVFGSKSQEDKLMAGDRKTPEGAFKILTKKPHSKWHMMLLLDYPTKESWAKFNNRKAKGIIPKSALIGGGIAIHGTWPNDNIVVDDYTNWTMGCISLKNEDLDELCEFLEPGVKVIIRK